MAKSGSVSVKVTSWDTLKFSWSETSQSVANNTSTISWKMELIAGSSGRISSTASKDWSVTVNGTEYSGTNKIGISNNATKTLASGTTTIEHNSDGTKTFDFSFSQEFDITFSGSKIGTKSGSGSGTLDTIPRKSTLSASNGTLGTAQTLTVTRKATSFTHTITYKCGSASGTVCTKSSDTSISWTPPLSLAQQNTTGSSVSVTFTITTYNGSTSIGSNTITITCSIPASVKPSVSVAVSDPNGYADTFVAYVQGQSKLKIVATASGSQGSTIKSYKTEADGKTYTAATVTTDFISGTGTLTIKVTVTDSRGRTATASKDISVLAYEYPKISALAVDRRDYDADGENYVKGGYLAVKFSGAITSLNSKNTATYTIQRKKSTETSYTTETLTDFSGQYSVSDGVFVFRADTASSYDIILTVGDAFASSTKTAKGSSVKKVWSLLKKAGEIVGIAFNKVAEHDGVFEIGFQTLFTGGIRHPTLEPETDLDDIRTPNTYIGANLADNNYTCGGNELPLSTGTFSLEVVGMGEEGQVKQRLTYCHKTASRAWERIYHLTGDVMSWGEWVCVSDFDGQLLWEGGRYMTADHTNALAEPVSKQRSGIVLVFSEYIDDATSDTAFHERFIPKTMVAKHPGKGHCFQLSSSNLDHFATKYLYISDDKIVGHSNNNMTGTGDCGITFNNARFVLRYVIGV